MFAATRVSMPLARRSLPLVDDETLIDFDAGLFPAGVLGDGVLDDGALGDGQPGTEASDVMIDPGLDLTGEIARSAPTVDDDEPSDRTDASLDGPPDTIVAPEWANEPPTDLDDSGATR